MSHKDQFTALNSSTHGLNSEYYFFQNHQSVKTQRQNVTKKTKSDQGMWGGEEISSENLRKLFLQK